MAMMNSAEMEDGSRPEEPHSLIYLPLIVKDKIIGLISVQSYHKDAYTSYHLNILKTIASYASAALYNAQSYMALQNTLNELKITQEQLVQQEKLASLGQLTAGIAHEIKNPLNFVNNFSEVSVELIEEARDEVREMNSKLKIKNSELSDILNDIETNLRKIHEHGSRADSIVKSMLEHSRGGRGKMEPTI